MASGSEPMQVSRCKRQRNSGNTCTQPTRKSSRIADVDLLSYEINGIIDYLPLDLPFHKKYEQFILSCSKKSKIINFPEVNIDSNNLTVEIGFNKHKLDAAIRIQHIKYIKINNEDIVFYPQQGNNYKNNNNIITQAEFLLNKVCQTYAYELIRCMRHFEVISNHDNSDHDKVWSATIPKTSGSIEFKPGQIIHDTPSFCYLSVIYVWNAILKLNEKDSIIKTYEQTEIEMLTNMFSKQSIRPNQSQQPQQNISNTSMESCELYIFDYEHKSTIKLNNKQISQVAYNTYQSTNQSLNIVMPKNKYIDALARGPTIPYIIRIDNVKTNAEDPHAVSKRSSGVKDVVVLSVDSLNVKDNRDNILRQIEILDKLTFTFTAKDAMEKYEAIRALGSLLTIHDNLEEITELMQTKLNINAIPYYSPYSQSIVNVDFSNLERNQQGGKPKKTKSKSKQTKPKSSRKQ